MLEIKTWFAWFLVWDNFFPPLAHVEQVLTAVRWDGELILEYVELRGQWDSWVWLEDGHLGPELDWFTLQKGLDCTLISINCKREAYIMI